MQIAIYTGIGVIISLLLIAKANYLAERIDREAEPHPRPLRWVERVLHTAWFIRLMGFVFLIFLLVSIFTTE